MSSIAGVLPCAIVQGLLSAPSFAKLPRHAPSQGFYRAIVPGDIFRDFLGIDSLCGHFRSVYFHAINPVAVFWCTLSQRIYPWSHPRELFACVFLQEPIPCALSQWFFQCVFLGLLCCTFPQNHSVCALYHDLSLGLFPSDFCRAFFRMDGFNLLFHRVVFSALSHWRFFGALFSGASSVSFLSGNSSMGSIAVAFSVGCLTGPFHFALFFKGEFHKLLRGDYFLTLFRSAFSRAFWR